MTSRIRDIELLSSQSFGNVGFLRLRRCQVQNVRTDGTRSGPYAVDMVERPLGLDAVVVLPYAQAPTRVVLRAGLRPVLRLGREGPQRDGQRPPLQTIEAVAGIVEAQDLGEAGLRHRAVLELHQELGLAVDHELLQQLGPPLYASCGVMAEQLFFFAVDIASTGLQALRDETARPQGDGTPMEEAGEPLIMSLDAALAHCDEGGLCDLKTECALRRLAARLSCGTARP